jgi:hypothetical protein
VLHISNLVLRNLMWHYFVTASNMASTVRHNTDY